LKAKKRFCASSSKGFVLLFLLLKQAETLETMAGGAEASEKATISAYNRSSSSFVKYIFVTVNMKDWV